MATASVVDQASESGQRVQLHPLVLLTVSDLITRHRVRQLEGPVAGIILGQQSKGQVTAEHAFTAKIKDGLLDQAEDWTKRRIEQYQEVHKNPALEVVGWFTLCPEDGPLSEHATLHKQLTSLYAENGILLAVHPQVFNHLQSPKARLPISIYDNTSDNEQPGAEGGMQVEHSERPMCFRRVPFVIETDETEMIAINYVAKGAGSAAALSQTHTKSSSKSGGSQSTSNGTSAEAQKSEESRGPTLTPQEEDQISGLTTRLNAIKMLRERVQTMSSLVTSTPPSYLSDQKLPMSPSSPSPEYLASIRNIQALLTRFGLLSPVSSPDTDSLALAGQAQANDVALTSILAMLGQDTLSLTELGRKFTRVEETKTSKAKNKGNYSDDFNARSGFFSPGFSSSAGNLMM